MKLTKKKPVKNSFGVDSAFSFIRAKRTFLIVSIVSLKFLSVSFGNPTITSVVIEISGLIFLILFIRKNSQDCVHRKLMIGRLLCSILAMGKCSFSSA